MRHRSALSAVRSNAFLSPRSPGEAGPRKIVDPFRHYAPASTVEGTHLVSVERPRSQVEGGWAPKVDCRASTVEATELQTVEHRTSTIEGIELQTVERRAPTIEGTELQTVDRPTSTMQAKTLLSVDLGQNSRGSRYADQLARSVYNLPPIPAAATGETHAFGH